MWLWNTYDKKYELHIYKLGRNGQQCPTIEKERTMKGYVMMYTLGETSLGFGLEVMIRGFFGRIYMLRFGCALLMVLW